MTAQKRLDALDKEIAGIEAEIETLGEDHAEAVTAGDDGVADQVHDQIADARKRMDAARARRGPLEAALEREQEAERAKVAKELTDAADASLNALEAAFSEAGKAAAKLAAITDALDENAALYWAVAAGKAVAAGGSPQRRHLAGIGETLDRARMAARKLGHVADDYDRRSVSIPVPTKSRAA
jgi:hypothetical protein